MNAVTSCCSYGITSCNYGNGRVRDHARDAGEEIQIPTRRMMVERRIRLSGEAIGGGSGDFRSLSSALVLEPVLMYLEARVYRW